MKKLLLTAFEPFGGKTLNPTLTIVKAIAGMRFEHVDIKILALPVACFAAVALTLKRIDQFQPDIVIMLGEAGGRANITPERVAINWDDFPITDNSGHQLQGQPIIKSAPVGYFSTLPIDDMVTQLKQANIPAEISNTAGLFVCNRLFYSVLHYIDQQHLAVMAGFIHVPFLPEQAINQYAGAPSLSQDVMIKGIQIAIDVCLEQYDQLKNSS